MPLRTAAHSPGIAAMLMLLWIAVNGCGQSTPTTEAGKEAVRAIIDKGKEERLKLSTFEKTDGVTGTVMGVSVYSLMFKADAQFVSDALFTPGNLLVDKGPAISTIAYKPESPSFNWNDFLASAQGYRPAKKGDVLHLTGTVFFEKRESGWVPTKLDFAFAHDSVGRGTLVQQSGAESTLLKSDGNQIATQRCTEHFAAHPLPKTALLDRIRGKRSSIASTLGDSSLALKAGSGSIGSAAYLTTGEICVGQLAVLSVSDITSRPDYYTVSLSVPSKEGFRLLMLAEVDRGLQYGWVIHPDSTRPLSGDLLKDYHYAFDASPGYVPMSEPTSHHWSPESRYVLLPARIADEDYGPGVLAAAIPHGSIKLISFKNLLNVPYQQETRRGDCDDAGCMAVIVDDSVTWTAPDVAKLRLRLFTNWPDQYKMPVDSVAEIVLDLTRGTASRPR